MESFNIEWTSHAIEHSSSWCQSGLQSFAELALLFLSFVSQLCVEGSFPHADKKMVHHTLQREGISLCSKITHRSLETCHSRSKCPRRWNHWLAQHQDYALRAGYKTTLQILQISTLSFLLHYSPTPPTLLRKHFLAWFERQRKIPPLKLSDFFFSMPRVLYRYLKFYVFGNQSLKVLCVYILPQLCVSLLCDKDHLILNFSFPQIKRVRKSCNYLSQTLRFVCEDKIHYTHITYFSNHQHFHLDVIFFFTAAFILAAYS